MKELDRDELIKVEGGGIVDTIKKGVAAVRALKEFFSGRPQL